MKSIKNIWTGVFIKKPRIEGDYFKDKNWHDKSKLRIKKLKKNNPPLCDNITPGFISALDKELKILDYGGGYGNLYYIFNRSINQNVVGNTNTVYKNPLNSLLFVLKKLQKDKVKVNNNFYVFTGSSVGVVPIMGKGIYVGKIDNLGTVKAFIK